MVQCSHIQGTSLVCVSERVNVCRPKVDICIDGEIRVHYMCVSVDENNFQSISGGYNVQSLHTHCLASAYCPTLPHSLTPSLTPGLKPPPPPLPVSPTIQMQHSKSREWPVSEATSVHILLLYTIHTLLHLQYGYRCIYIDYHSLSN